MKKILCYLLSFICFFSLCTSTTFALEKTENSSTYIEYLDDGYYIETTITQNDSPSYFRATKTASGSKKVSYKNGNNVLWTVSVSGSFSYNDSSAICTYSSVSTTCPNNSWKIASKSASKNGSTAIAYATGKNYQLGVCIQTINRTVKLTCSSSGKLS